ncbi:MAG TPA: CDP-alcohol phosphatidyltransferase family protein [Xanthomonadales bacterium]|nr:CDP-alcohol phosphatidyltransferase family protein [Xanthomonadales bacterium]
MPDDRSHNQAGSHTGWGWLPNAISLARLGCMPVLVWLAVVHQATAFAVLLVLALASDLVDGWLARHLRAVSRLGAVLDSMGDMALSLAILAGIWFLQPQVIEEDGWIIYGLLLAWVLAHCASLLRYGRLASYHTWLIRIGIALFNLFAVILFVFDYYPWLLYLSASLSLLGVIEHFLLLMLLPEWTPNIPGGIFRVWQRRRA